MFGLPETFDMVKRLGLILYFPTNTDREKPFDDIFINYHKDFNWIQNDLMQYRSDCKNLWSQNKCRLGQPQISSKTSFSKYMRVAHGMNLITMEKNQESWHLKPTNLTKIVNILYDSNQKQKNPLFELPINLKFLFFKNLLKIDGIFLLPILKSLNDSEVSSDTGFLNREFLLACSNNLSKSFINSLNTQYMKPQEARIQIKRLNFFQENQSRLENNNEPTRGFLHIIEPRIHWLIDLLLINNSVFCQDGKIQPADFLSNSFNYTKNNQEMIITKYFDYLLSLKGTDNRYQNNISISFDETIEYAIGELKKYYPRLVPLESAVLLIQILESTKSGKFIPSDDILQKLKQKYTILRDWNEEEGFLDVDFGKSINKIS